MMKKISVYFISLAIFLLILEIVEAQYPETQQCLKFFFRIYQNDTVELLDLKIAEGKPSISTIGDYKIRVVSEDGKTLHESRLDVFFMYEKKKENGVLVDYKLKEFVDVFLSLPYYPQASSLQLFHGNKKIFQQEIPRLETEEKIACGNGICDLDEDFYNCPVDCSPLTTTTIKITIKPVREEKMKTPSIHIILLFLIFLFLVLMLLAKIKIVGRKASFLTKGIYLILIMVVIAIFLNRVLSLQLFSSQEKISKEIASSAMHNLDILTGSEECLAVNSSIKINNINLELPPNRMLDVSKLDDFSFKFNEIEPDCCRDYNFGYRVRVETIPMEINSIPFNFSGTIFNEILQLIDSKNILFLLDSSGSMRDPAGVVSKIECLKDFMKAFVNQFKAGSGIAIIAYGLYSGDVCKSDKGVTGCCIKRILDLTILNGNRNSLIPIIDSLVAAGNTPISLALEEGFVYAISNNIHAIVLLTDGKETCMQDVHEAIKVAQKYKNYGIPVYTIGLGTVGVDFDLLKEIAKITSGKFFDARMCEELVSPKPREDLNVKIPEMFWEFGSTSFSKGDSLREELLTSIPVTIYFNQSTILPGKMTIRIVEGELESFVNVVERACATKEQARYRITLSYPTNIYTDRICMNFRSGMECQKIACDVPIELESLSPGKYEILVQPTQNSIKVIV